MEITYHWEGDYFIACRYPAETKSYRKGVFAYEITI